MNTLKTVKSEIAAIGTVALTLLLFVISIPVLLIFQPAPQKAEEPVATSNV